MPTTGKCWRQVVICTHNSWLPGDPRGFRTEEHKVHSSGDYKNPPPKGEHKGLLSYRMEISGQAVQIPADLRETVGRKIIAKLQEGEHRVLAVSIAATHTQLLVELPDNIPAVRRVIGLCKSSSSHTIRKQVPGRIWARHGGFKKINDVEHQQNVFRYILNQKDAWVWSYKDDEKKDSQE